MKLPLIVLVAIFGYGSFAQDAPFSKLMIVNGDPTDESQQVEVIDLEDPLAVCFNPASFPSARSGSVGTFINGQVMVCGGYGNFALKDCNIYNSAEDTWEDSEYEFTRNRDLSAGIMVSDTEWWVTGGYASEGKLATTETFTVGQGFSPSIDLPTDMDLHNVIRLNETHFFIVGGFPHDGLAFYFDYPNQQFFEAESMSEAKHATFSGLITRPSDGTQYVVVGGGYYDGYFYLSTTEIFDLATGTWSAGPELPYGIGFGASVQYGDTFLAVGGYSLGTEAFGPQATIFKFDNEDFGWIEMPQTLQVSRNQFTAILVPDSVVECT